MKNWRLLYLLLLLATASGVILSQQSSSEEKEKAPGTKQKITRLLAELKKPDQREQAAQRLQNYGKQIVKPLTRFLLSKKHTLETRETGIQVLVNLAVPESQKALLYLLTKNIDDAVAVFLIQGLSELGAKEAIPILEKLLEHPHLRGSAALALGKLQAQNATSALINNFPKQTGSAQTYFIKALGSLQSPEAVPLLTSLLTKADRETCLHILEALACIDDPSAAEHILKHLRSQQETEVILRSIEVLGKLGNKISLDLLQRFSQTENVNIKIRAIEALGQLNDESALPLLERHFYQGKPAVAQKSLQAIFQTHRPESVEILFAASRQHPDAFIRWQAWQKIPHHPFAQEVLLPKLAQEETRERAKKMLASLGASATQPLLKAYEQNKIPKQVLVEVLGDLGDKRVVSFLLQQLDESTSSAIRKECIEALGKLGDPKAKAPLKKLLEQTSAQDELYPSLILALSRLGETQTLPRIKEYLRENQVSLTFLKSLKKFSDPDLREILIRRLAQEQNLDRVATICHSLRDLSQENKQQLATILRDKPFPAKVFLLGLLAREGEEKSQQNLLFVLLSGQETVLRQLAFRELLSLQTKKIIPYLLALLKDENPVIHTLAREELIRIVGKDLGSDPQQWKTTLKKYLKEPR